MRFDVLVLSLSLMLCASSSDSYSGVISRTDVSGNSVRDGENGPKYLALAIPTPRGVPSSQIAYAEIRFLSTSPQGTEVELWEDPGEGAIPWGAEESERLGTWVVNQRTPGFVRFDITDLFRAWCEANSDGEILLRVAPNQDVEDLDIAATPAFRVTYHRIDRD